MIGPVATALAVAAAAAVAGCAIDDRDVLVVGPVLQACDEAFRRVSDHQACAFTGVCALPLPGAPACCAELVACRAGTLSVTPYCDSGCISCGGDGDCPAGERLCDGSVCTPCPDPTTCAACAMGTVPVVRNGCTTCECGPASECTGAADPACDPMTGLVCYPGQRCGLGCLPEEPGCCLNVCSTPGCASPAPLGCDTPCPPNLGCPSCQTAGCRCDGMAWTCDAVCAEPTGACFFPR